jgi:hypothetical protein
MAVSQIYKEDGMNAKVENIINVGESIPYEYYYQRIDLKWIVKYEGKFYHVPDKDSPPIEISENKAREILSSYPESWATAVSLGWWSEGLDK